MFNGDIAKICKLILGTLTLPGYTYVGEIPITILAFIIDYFQEKLTSQNLSKNPKNSILGSFEALLPKLGPKMNFLGKNGSVSFSISELPTIVPKIRKT